jgi:hypothetical protein
MCLVIVKAEKGATGSFTVKAASKGLKGSEVVSPDRLVKVILHIIIVGRGCLIRAPSFLHNK